MKKGALLLIIIPCLLILTSCWNRRELNELALVVGVAIDKVDDEYLVTVQVVDPGEIALQSGGGGRAPVTTYTERGTNIFETVRRMTTIAPRKLYFSHLQMLIISEEIAKDGVKNTLDFFMRDPEFRKDFFLAISKGINASEVMKNLTSIEKIPSNKLHTSLETSERAWAPTTAMQLDEFLLDLLGEGTNPVLAGITIKGGDLEQGHSMKNLETISDISRLQYQSIAVFKRDSLVGWLNERESKGYSYIMNKVTNTVGDIPCPDNNRMVIEIVRSKVDIKGIVKKGQPRINIKVSAEGNVAEVACNMDLTKPESIKKLEEATSKENEDILKTTIQRAKELGVDIFGFGEVIHRSDPKAWHSLKEDWDQKFVDLPVTVKTDFKFRRTGVVNQSFLEKLKEK